MTPWFVLVVTLAFVATYLLTPLAIVLGRRWGLVDEPGGRRRHAGPVVRIGGLALYPAFAVAILATLPLARTDSLEWTRITGVLAGMAVVWAMGLLDDRYSLPPSVQFGGLALAAVVAVVFRVFIELFNDPFGDAQVHLAWYGMLPLTLLWLVGMSGTVNMVDGLDGLAAGITAIAAAVLFAHMLRLGQHSVALLPLALLGCCLGFLPYNLRNPRIFLGGGAYVLGYALGAISIVAGAKVAMALLVVWVPIVDVLWQIYCRWRRGQPLGLGDRGHLHFRLLDLGWSQARIVCLYCIVTIGLGAVGLLVSSRLLKLTVMGGIALLLIALLAVLARLGGDHTATGR